MSLNIVLNVMLMNICMHFLYKYKIATIPTHTFTLVPMLLMICYNIYLNK